MRISDWSSDVCSSDLCALHGNPSHSGIDDLEREYPAQLLDRCILYHYAGVADGQALAGRGHRVATPGEVVALSDPSAPRSEEHTSELQSLMRISYAVFCLKKKNKCNITRYQIA